MAADKYASAAREHGECTLQGDSDAGTKAYAQMMQALRKLQENPDRGESVLLNLIDHFDDWVKVWAATHLLPVSEKPARAVLERLANGPSSLLEFNAKMVLQEWDAGKLR